MLVYFIGGSLGTAFGPIAVAHSGWPVTALMAAAVILAATVLTLANRPTTPPTAEPVLEHQDARS